MYRIVWLLVGLALPHVLRAQSGLKALSPEARDEVLWLARCIYSETTQPHEQEIIAWVVRNRVEQRYRGKSTYREVVLDPYQFSAFNPGHPRREYLLRLHAGSRAPGWSRALAIALRVYRDPGLFRPIPRTVLHFYSPHARPTPPPWSRGKTPLRVRGIAPERFLFFAGVDLPAPSPASSTHPPRSSLSRLLRGRIPRPARPR